MSPALLALQGRLEAAGPNFVLDAALVQAPSITGLFGSLLGFRSDAIPVADARVGTADGGVRLTASGDFFGVRGVSATFQFTDGADGGLQLALAGSLGPMTVPQMYARGILPYSGWGNSAQAAALGGFPRLSFALESADAALSIGGAASSRAWDVIGLAGVSLGIVAPAIVRTAPALPAAPEWNAWFLAVLTLGGTRLSVRVSPPGGALGWQVALGDPEGVRLGSLSALSALGGGGSANLPAPVVALGDFWITDLVVGFLPDRQLWQVAAGLAVGRPVQEATPAWRLLPGVLELEHMEARLAWALVPSSGGGAPACTAVGTLSGRIRVLGQSVSAVVPVPLASGEWQLAASPSLALSGLAQLAPYFGGTDYLTSALAPLGTLTGLSLTGLTAGGAASPFSLDQVGFGLEAETWTISALPWFTVSGISLAAVVTHPLPGGTRAVAVEVGATLSLGTVLQLAVSGGYEDGLLSLEWTGVPFDAVALSDLSSLVSAAQVSAAVPAQSPHRGLVHA